MVFAPGQVAKVAKTDLWEVEVSALPYADL